MNKNCPFLNLKSTSISFTLFLHYHQYHSNIWHRTVAFFSKCLKFINITLILIDINIISNSSISQSSISRNLLHIHLSYIHQFTSHFLYGDAVDAYQGSPFINCVQNDQQENQHLNYTSISEIVRFLLTCIKNK